MEQPVFCEKMVDGRWLFMLQHIAYTQFISGTRKQIQILQKCLSVKKWIEDPRVNICCFVHTTRTYANMLILSDDNTNSKKALDLYAISVVKSFWCWSVQQGALLPRRAQQNNANYTAIMPYKVTNVSTNRKPICDFLLVTNSNLPPILHRLQVMADYWSNFRYRHESASL